MYGAFLYLSKYNQSVIYPLILFLALGVGSCHNTSQHRQWDSAIIDPTIFANLAYQQMDDEKEVFSMGDRRDKQDTSAKRSSGVLYFTKAHANLFDSNSAKHNNCRAYFFHGDTLTINIGFGTGFGGRSFIINYRDKKFYAEPYYTTDIIDPDDPEPVYEIVYQKLTLNKSAYKVGDSLYGKIDFKAIEIGQDKTKNEHSGKGYFRTKVNVL